MLHDRDAICLFVSFFMVMLHITYVRISCSVPVGMYGTGAVRRRQGKDLGTSVVARGRP
jgi:hypothetical protein